MFTRNQFKAVISRSNSTAVHFILVELGGETFGVPAAQIREIICLGDLESIPRLPKRSVGLVRVLEKLIYLVKVQAPFIRSRTEFGIAPCNCILVLKAHSAISEKIPKAVLVDRVERIIEFEEEDVETVSTRRKGPWSTLKLGFTPRRLPMLLFDLEELISTDSIYSRANGSGANETATSRLRRRAP